MEGVWQPRIKPSFFDLCTVNNQVHKSALEVSQEEQLIQPRNSEEITLKMMINSVMTDDCTPLRQRAQVS